MATPSLDGTFPLYFFGNHCIQNSRFRIGSYPRNAPAFELETTQVARGYGSVIQNRRIGARELSLEVQITTLPSGLGETVGWVDTNRFDSSYPINRAHIEELKRIFSYDNRLLREMPESSYILINRGNDRSNWNFAGNVTSLLADVNLVGIDNASVKSITSVGSGSATQDEVFITSAASVNISNIPTTLPIASSILTNTNNTLYRPCWEFAVYIPNDIEFTALSFRIGSSNTNYYFKNDITTNYEGRKIERGWNWLSIPHDQMGTTGTPNLTIFGSYIWLLHQYTPQRTSYPSIQDGIQFGGLLLVQDALVKNYLSTRSGEVTISQSPYEQRFPMGSVKLLNNTGYSSSTHAELLYSATGITALTNTQSFDAKGTFEVVLPIITLTSTTATNMSKIRITDVSDPTNFVDFTNTFANNDSLVIDSQNKQTKLNGKNQEFTGGKLLRFRNGLNQIKYDIFQSSDSIVSQTQSNSNQAVATGSDGVPFGGLAQRFEAPITGTLTSAEVLIETPPTALNGRVTYLIDIRSDSAGTPSNTVLQQVVAYGDSAFGFKKLTTPFSLSVTAGTRYWIVYKRYSATQYYFGSGANAISIGVGFLSGPTGWSLSRSTAANADSSWTTVSGQAMVANFIFAPTPSVNNSWSMTYKRLYN